MRNYFKQLNLTTAATHEEIAQTLAPNMQHEHEMNESFQADCREILMQSDRRQVYANTSNMYLLLNHSLECLCNGDAKDTHQWALRLEDFSS